VPIDLVAPVALPVEPARPPLMVLGIELCSPLSV
jgi:hypothetical protein